MKTLLDFENLSDLTFVTDDYLPQGVLIPNGASVHNHPAMAHSGQNYLNPWRQEFAPTAWFRAVFTPRRQQTVSLYAGTEGAQGNWCYGILRALGPAGTQVAMDGPRVVTMNKCNTRFEVSTTANQIAGIELQMFAFEQSGLPYDPDQAVDDLQFEFAALPVRNIRVEPPIFDRWWWIKTLGGLVPPPPRGDPMERWLEPFAVARSLAHAAEHAAPALRAEARALALKQAALADEAIRDHVKQPAARRSGTRARPRRTLAGVG